MIKAASKILCDWYQAGDKHLEATQLESPVASEVTTGVPGEHPLHGRHHEQTAVPLSGYARPSARLTSSLRACPGSVPIEQVSRLPGPPTGFLFLTF